MKKYLPVNSASLQHYQAKSVSELWKKAQAEGYQGLTATCALEIETPTVITEADGTQTKKFHAVFSSANQDRHGDVVHQNFDMKAFKKNPVFIDSHNYDSIEHIIGRIEPIGVKEGMLQGDIQFAMMNPKGALASQMAEAGYLNTTSIGFIPKEFDDQGNPTKSELLEISAVSVPANPDALFENAIEPPEQKQVEEPAPAAEPAVVEEPTPAAEPAPEPEPLAKANPRRAIKDAFDNLQTEQKRHLKVIARELGKIEHAEMNKRKVYQSIRALLKDTDIAA